MKKLLSFLSLFIVLTAFTCDDEPIDADILSNQVCEQVTAQATAAAVTLGLSTESNYFDNCYAYRLALQAQIQSCGDDDGTIQAIIDGLGDCEYVNNNPNNSLIGTWIAQSFQANITNTITAANGDETIVNLDVEGANLNYNVTFSESNFSTIGGYDMLTTLTINGTENPQQTTNNTDVTAEGAYSTSGNMMTISGAMFNLSVDGIDTSGFENEQMVTYTISDNGQQLTLTQNEDTTENIDGGGTIRNVTVSTSVWMRQ